MSVFPTRLGSMRAGTRPIIVRYIVFTIVSTFYKYMIKCFNAGIKLVKRLYELLLNLFECFHIYYLY